MTFSVKTTILLAALGAVAPGCGVKGAPRPPVAATPQQSDMRESPRPDGLDPVPSPSATPPSPKATSKKKKASGR